MKKLLSALLILALAFSLCACDKRKSVTMVVEISVDRLDSSLKTIDISSCEKIIQPVFEGEYYLFSESEGMVLVDDREKIRSFDWTIKIENIEDDQIEITVGGEVGYRDFEYEPVRNETFKVDYGQEMYFNTYVVFVEGSNISYSFRFEKS